MIRPKYKNDLFSYLSQSKYGIDSFEYGEEKSNGQDAFVITFKGTGLKFYFLNAPASLEYFGYLNTTYAPGFPVVYSSNNSPNYSFEQVKKYFIDWLEYQVGHYVKDKQEPDLWEMYLHTNNSFNLTKVDFSDQTSFNQEEKLQIQLVLQEIKLLIQQSFQTTKEQQLLVDERINYLVKSTGRLNRFDWLGTLINTIIAISVALTLDAEKGRLLFELFKRALANVKYLGH